VRRKLLLLLNLVLLAGCQPLYVPPLLEAQAPEERARLELELTAPEGRPVLSVRVIDVVTDGWLAIQWFTPGGREVASESIWLDAERIGLRYELPLPADVETVPGEWRALLSQHSTVIRQLTVTVD